MHAGPSDMVRKREPLKMLSNATGVGHHVRDPLELVDLKRGFEKMKLHGF